MTKITMRTAVLVNVLTVSMVFLLMLGIYNHDTRKLNRKVAELKTNISLLADEELMEVAKDIDKTGYTYQEYIDGYDDQIYELEAELDEKDSKVKKYSRIAKTIKDYYAIKLENSSLNMYHIESDLMNEDQKAKADEIAYYVANNYDKYGVLPSVAVGQAMAETQIGKADAPAAPYYGYWGVISSNGYAKYGSLEEGLKGYLKCLNNGLYDNALFQSNPFISLQHIENGGYCAGNYATKVAAVINTYNFQKYDEFYFGRK